jgi:hypothetical protein
MFPAIKELLKTKTIDEAIEGLIKSPDDPQDDENPRKKQKRDGALPIPKKSYSDTYQRWARYHLLYVNRHVPIKVIEAIFFANQYYFTGTLIEILSKIESGEIILSEIENPYPSEPEGPNQPPTLLKVELDAHSNRSTMRDLRNAFRISKAELVECQCCFSKFPIYFKTTRCESNHHFWFDCSARGLNDHIDRVKSVSCFECGVMVCEDVISTSEIRRFLPPDEFAGMCVSFHT